jgi:GTPase KRas
MKDSYIFSSDGFILLYDITKTDSFHEITLDIDQILKVKDEEKVPIVLVGTKCDLEDDRKISIEEGMEFARKNGIPFFESSAKLNINVEEVIFTLIDEIVKSKKIPPPQTANTKGKKDCLMM